jgi:uncharacterized protein (DUF488 family)
MPASNAVSDKPRGTREIFTIGHSSRPLDEFIGLLAESRIERLVDVRSLPGSRAFPQYNAEALRDSLAGAGVDYEHIGALGGRRGRSLPKDDTRNAMWRNASFRHYADYALTPAFAEGLQDLEARGVHERCAIMCAEAVWWRCHRRIITDHLIARGWQVRHIIGAGKTTAATLTPGADVAGGGVTYPAAAESEGRGARGE